MKINLSEHLNFENLFLEDEFSEIPFPCSRVTNLFSQQLFEYLYGKINSFLAVESNIKMLEEEYLKTEKDLKRIGKPPSINFPLDRWDEIGVSSQLYKALD